MVFRFRKSFKIAPGVRLNVGKRGSSLSLGGRGATVNVSKRGTRTTLGIPGTGLSYSSTTSSRQRSSRQSAKGDDGWGWALIILLALLGLLIL